MKLENWFEACKEKPKTSGEYLVKYKNKSTIHAFYLKAGSKILLRSEPLDDKPESKILYALCAHDFLVNITSDGFYSCVTCKGGGEKLKYLAPKDLYWSTCRNKLLAYKERLSKLKENEEDTGISEKALAEELGDYIKRDNRIRMIYEHFLHQLNYENFSFCGTNYVTDKFSTDHAFLKAIKIREIIISLKEYPNIGKLSQMAFGENAKELFPLMEALSLRDDLRAYLKARGEKTDDIETISDAFFIKLFLPEKKDVIRVLLKNETAGAALTKEMLVVKVFQRYQIIDSIRQIGMLYSPERKKDPFNDIMVDTIATSQLAQALALNRFKIKEFLEVFNIEMGIA